MHVGKAQQLDQHKEHVSNQSLSYMFHSTSNLVHSWFSKEKEPPQEEEVEEPQRRTSAKF